MFQAFPGSRQELRIYRNSAAAGTTVLVDDQGGGALNVSGQPRCCGIVDLIVNVGHASVTYDFGAGGDNHHFMVEDAGGNVVRDHTPSYPMPTKIRNDTGADSISVELITVGVGQDCSVVYLVNKDEIV